jgi:hypothetical protein
MSGEEGRRPSKSAARQRESSSAQVTPLVVRKEVGGKLRSEDHGVSSGAPTTTGESVRKEVELLFAKMPSQAAAHDTSTRRVPKRGKASIPDVRKRETGKRKNNKKHVPNSFLRKIISPSGSPSPARRPTVKPI